MIGFVDPGADAGSEDTIQITPTRMIGGFSAQVTFEENHMDELLITDHPVETGATISDHAYMRPSEVTIRCGWSESPKGEDAAGYGILGGAFAGVASQIGTIGGSLGGLGSATSGSSVGAPREMYQNLLELQKARVPFEIFTGKRVYQNMLVRSIQVRTDLQNENILNATIVCREVLRVSTQVVSVGAPASDQAEPESTQPTSDQGEKQLSEAQTYDADKGADSINASGPVYQLPDGYYQDPKTGNIFDGNGVLNQDLMAAVGTDRAEPQRSM